MIRQKHERLTLALLAIDAVASNLALLAAWFLRFALAVVPLTKGTQQIAVYTEILPLVTVIFPLAFSLQGLYRYRGTRTRAEELASVAVAAVVGTIILSGLLLWIRPNGLLVEYSRATLALFMACEVTFVMLGRLLVRRAMERRYRAGRNLDSVLIAGSGELAHALVERMRAHEELGFRIAGFVSNDENPTLVNLPHLGLIEEAPELIDRLKIDHVFVALPHASGPSMMRLLEQLSRHYVSIHVVPDLLQFMALRSRVEDIDGLPTVNLSDTPLAGWNRSVKRLFDLLIATTALLIFSPVMLLIGLLVWLEDRGKIFYRQTRMGLDGVPFEILKFRSMHLEAEASTGPIWASKSDHRTTRIGRVIRGWSLDELPQLWNVIRGDMSVVGPRPERPQFVEQFRAEFPHYMLRHKVRAGITGWAQVNGWRGNTSMRKRIEHDLYYIENWSLLFDLKILLLTIRHGWRHENAY